MAQPIKIYILHHHSDSKDMNILSMQLEMLRTKALVQTWSVENMIPGSHRDETIRQELAKASIVLALISPDYLADSEYCMKIQQEAYQTGKAIIPVILRNCMWDMDDILQPLNPLPYEEGTLKVASQWDKKEDAFASVVRHIRSKLAGEEIKHRPTNPTNSQGKNTKTILFMGATPNDAIPLALTREIRNIRGQLRENDKEKAFLFEDEPAVRTSDIQQVLIRYKPTIIHFSGHGEGEDGLVFEDALGNAKLVRTEALDSVFQTFKKSVECVVLNACYSIVQAEVISKHIPYVIGMLNKVPDDTALSFSFGFYLGLGAGEGYETAFDMGKNQMKIDGFLKWEPILLINKH